jgi:hypothetical protein
MPRWAVPDELDYVTNRDNLDRRIAAWQGAR